MAIRKVCGTCGSDDVRHDAWAEWNEQSQQFELAEFFDNGYCNVCEGECSIIDQEIPDPKEGISIDKKLEYLGHSYHCPFCGDIKIESNDRIEPDEGNKASQKVSCTVCNKEWLDIYKLIDVIEVTK